MRDLVDGQGQPLPDCERLTAFGKFVRKTSLDELPALWNVLQGHLSLVGPRPLLMNYLPFFTEREQLRFTVRPGITGWAQIHGRNYSPWDQRLENDLWYVQNWSFKLDMKILFRTIGQVLRTEGVSVDSYAAIQSLDQERATQVAGRQDFRY